MIRRPPRSTLDRSSAASDVYNRQLTYTPKQVIKAFNDYHIIIQLYSFYDMFACDFAKVFSTCHLPPLSTMTEKKDLNTCLLYTSDAADERSSVDLGGRRIIKKK